MRSFTSVTVALLVLRSFIAPAQTPDILWQACSGKNAADWGTSAIELKNGHYLVAGTSFLATGHKGGSDYWLVELDKGEMVWEKNYGGSGADQCQFIIQTNDGGFILVGQSDSKDGDITNPKGYYDCWVVKLDSGKNMEWQRSLGGSFTDYGGRAVATADGGCLIATNTRSKDGDVTGMHGYQDIWLVKLDVLGNIEWQKCYGGSGSDMLGDIANTADGGFVVTGSSSPQPATAVSIYDVWLFKVDDTGAIQWQKTYGGSNNDNGRSVKQTGDGGYVFLASTASKDGDVAAFRDTSDIWLVKVDDTGKIEWQKTFGGSNVEYAHTVEATADGYVVLGTTISTDGDVIGNHGQFDMWVIKTYKNGQIEWRRMLGGSNNELGGQLIRSRSGGYVVVGNTQSQDGDVVNPLAKDDYWTIALGQFPTNVTSPSIEKIKVYPSVSSGTVYIDMHDDGTLAISVHDIIGRHVPVEITESSDRIAVNLLANVSGMYIINVQAGERSAAYRIQLVK